jgi:hypothetical protein
MAPDVLAEFLRQPHIGVLARRRGDMRVYEGKRADREYQARRRPAS